jgi:phosphatidylserine/phosphatidylglycerophosphate/cardiolipin synthase-like enzyme
MSAIASHPPTRRYPSISGSVALTFSPKGDAESLVVGAIVGASISVHVQAYEFSSLPICNAIINAHQAGREVLVLLDKANKVNPLSKWFNTVGRHSLLPQLRAAGVPVLFDSSPTIAHSKIVIVDGRTVVTGSFNFSRAAQQTNTENLLVIDDMAVAAAYEANFNWRRALSKA